MEFPELFSGFSVRDHRRRPARIGARLCAALLAILIFSASLCPSLAQDEAEPTTSEPDLDLAHDEPTTTLHPLRTFYANMEDTARNFFDGRIRQLLPEMLRASSETNMSPECQAANFKLFQGLRSLRAWAVMMIDATGRPASGTLTGTLRDFGNYEECLRIRVRDEDDGNEIYRGKYCTLKFRGPLPPRPERIHYDMDIWATLGDNFTLEEGSLTEAMAKHSLYFYHLSSHMGVCIPSECSAEDIGSLANYMLRNYNWTVTVTDCDVDEQPVNVRTSHKVAIVSILVMIVLALLGTFITACYRLSTGSDESQKPKGTLIEFFASFSLYENSVKLFKTEQQPGVLSVIHGLKFFSMCWVILCHCYIFTNPEAVVSVQNIQRDPFKYSFQLLMSGWLAVDTFFMLGGLALTYGSMKYMQQHNGKLSIFMYFFHRIWRLLPPLGFAIAIMVIVPLLGRGPLWKETVEYQGEKCEMTWWKTLFFISNWSTNYETICLETTWYLQCDLQLYAVALLVILPMYKRPALAALINISLTLISIAIFMGIILAKHYPPVMVFLHPDVELTKEMARTLYYRPYTHYGPYAVGLFLGYLMFKTPKWQTNKFLAVLGWVLALGTQWAVIYGITPWHSHYDKLGFPQYLYAATHRTIWALTVGYVVWAVHYGYGGWIGQFLTWKAFIPLSRLVFMVYLVHPIVIFFKRGSAQERSYLRHFPEMTWQFLGDTTFSFGCAYAMSMLFEVPVINLEKIVLRPLMGNAEGRRMQGEVAAHREASDRSSGTATKKRDQSMDLSQVYRRDNDLHCRSYRPPAEMVATMGYRHTGHERL